MERPGEGRRAAGERRTRDGDARSRVVVREDRGSRAPALVREAEHGEEKRGEDDRDFEQDVAPHRGPWGRGMEEQDGRPEDAPGPPRDPAPQENERGRAEHHRGAPSREHARLGDREVADALGEQPRVQGDEAEHGDADRPDANAGVHAEKITRGELFLRLRLRSSL